jgi:hypothetical protein
VASHDMFVNTAPSRIPSVHDAVAVPHGSHRSTSMQNAQHDRNLLASEQHHVTHVSLEFSSSRLTKVAAPPRSKRVCSTPGCQGVTSRQTWLYIYTADQCCKAGATRHGDAKPHSQHMPCATLPGAKLMVKQVVLDDSGCLP